MVPSNFKQNVKENANLVSEERKRSNNTEMKIYCAVRKLIFLNAIRRVHTWSWVFDYQAT